MDELLTTKQLQYLLQVDRLTIYRMLNAGQLKGFKVGGQWRFSRQEIEDWLQAQRSNLEVADDRLDSPVETVSDSTAHVLPLSCIQAMQSIFAEAIDIAAITIGPDGALLTEISNSCAFCQLILASDEGRWRCVAAWQQVDAEGFHTCHAGLLVASKRITVASQCVATTACCQFTAESPAGGEKTWQPNLSKLGTTLSVPESELRDAAGSVRFLPENQLRRVSRLLHQVAATFSEIGQERLRLTSRLQRISEISSM